MQDWFSRAENPVSRTWLDQVGGTAPADATPVTVTTGDMQGGVLHTGLQQRQGCPLPSARSLRLSFPLHG